MNWSAGVLECGKNKNGMDSYLNLKELFGHGSPRIKQINTCGFGFQFLMLDILNRLRRKK
jgi:hypothetical protein